MSVGFPATKLDIDARAGQLALQLRDTLIQIQQFNTWLVATPDANLTGMTPGYTAGEVATLKSAIADLAQLATVYQGTAIRASVYNYQTFAKLLVGVV
jgi:hypothetical protein